MSRYAEWRVLIEERDYASHLGIAFVSNEGESRIQGLIGRAIDPDRPIITFEKVRDGDLLKDSLVLPINMALPFFREASLYLTSKGIRPVEQSFVEGKLEATEAHLRDIRYLMKLPRDYRLLK